jgi:hypothetical protein
MGPMAASTGDVVAVTVDRDDSPTFLIRFTTAELC